MKRIIILSLFFCCAISSFSQEYKKVYLGKDVNAYKGLQMKFENGYIFGTRYYFYSTPPKKEYEKPVYKPTVDYDFETDTAAIANREFLVVNVNKFNTNSYPDEKYIFELKDILNNETIYFVYNNQLEYSFPFLVKGFSYTTDYVKADLESEVDDFTNEKKIFTPLLKDVSIMKIIKKGVPVYYLSLRTYGSTLNYRGKGVLLLFKDGTKWNKPEEKIDVKIAKGNWEYTAFVRLSQADVNLFSNKIINKFRLYIYDNKTPDITEKFMYYMKAISTMK